jgi:NACHT domain
MALRNVRLAYIAQFSFDFRDESRQSCNSLLRSLLFQLSTQSDDFSDKLSHLHSLYEDSKQRPSNHKLTRCLKAMLSHSAHSVYLIIDGVDECPDTPARQQVLNFIEELVGYRLSNLHICATSRPEVGALKDLTTLSVSLHKQRGHKQDIIDYIYSAVYSDPKMGIWSEKDKRLVADTLSKKADGV